MGAQQGAYQRGHLHRPGVTPPPGLNTQGINPPAMNPVQNFPPGLSRPGRNPPGGTHLGVNHPAASPREMNHSTVNHPAVNPGGMNQPAVNQPVDCPEVNQPGVNDPGQNHPGRSYQGQDNPGPNPLWLNPLGINPEHLATPQEVSSSSYFQGHQVPEAHNHQFPPQQVLQGLESNIQAHTSQAVQQATYPVDQSIHVHTPNHGQSATASVLYTYQPPIFLQNLSSYPVNTPLSAHPMTLNTPGQHTPLTQPPYPPGNFPPEAAVSTSFTQPSQGHLPNLYLVNQNVQHHYPDPDPQHPAGIPFPQSYYPHQLHPPTPNIPVPSIAPPQGPYTNLHEEQVQEAPQQAMRHVLPLHQNASHPYLQHPIQQNLHRYRPQSEDQAMVHNQFMIAQHLQSHQYPQGSSPFLQNPGGTTQQASSAEQQPMLGLLQDLGTGDQRKSLDNIASSPENSFQRLSQRQLPRDQQEVMMASQARRPETQSNQAPIQQGTTPTLRGSAPIPQGPTPIPHVPASFAQGPVSSPGGFATAPQGLAPIREHPPQGPPLIPEGLRYYPQGPAPIRRSSAPVPQRPVPPPRNSALPPPQFPAPLPQGPVSSPGGFATAPQGLAPIREEPPQGPAPIPEGLRYFPQGPTPIPRGSAPIPQGPAPPPRGSAPPPAQAPAAFPQGPATRPAQHSLSLAQRPAYTDLNPQNLPRLDSQRSGRPPLVRQPALNVPGQQELSLSSLNPEAADFNPTGLSLPPQGPVWHIAVPEHLYDPDDDDDLEDGPPYRVKGSNQPWNHLPWEDYLHHPHNDEEQNDDEQPRGRRKNFMPGDVLAPLDDTPKIQQPPRANPTCRLKHPASVACCICGPPVTTSSHHSMSSSLWMPSLQRLRPERKKRREAALAQEKERVRANRQLRNALIRDRRYLENFANLTERFMEQQRKRREDKAKKEEEERQKLREGISHRHSLGGAAHVSLHMPSRAQGGCVLDPIGPRIRRAPLRYVPEYTVGRQRVGESAPAISTMAPNTQDPGDAGNQDLDAFHWQAPAPGAPQEGGITAPAVGGAEPAQSALTITDATQIVDTQTASEPLVTEPPSGTGTPGNEAPTFTNTESSPVAETPSANESPDPPINTTRANEAAANTNSPASETIPANSSVATDTPPIIETSPSENTPATEGSSTVTTPLVTASSPAQNPETHVQGTIIPIKPEETQGGGSAEAKGRSADPKRPPFTWAKVAASGAREFAEAQRRRAEEARKKAVEDMRRKAHIAQAQKQRVMQRRAENQSLVQSQTQRREEAERRQRTAVEEKEARETRDEGGKKEKTPEGKKAQAGDEKQMGAKVEQKIKEEEEEEEEEEEREKEKEQEEKEKGKEVQAEEKPKTAQELEDERKSAKALAAYHAAKAAGKPYNWDEPDSDDEKDGIDSNKDIGKFEETWRVLIPDGARGGWGMGSWLEQYINGLFPSNAASIMLSWKKAKRAVSGRSPVKSGCASVRALAEVVYGPLGRCA